MKRILSVAAILILSLVVLSAGYAQTGYAVLHNFALQTDDGAMPMGDLLLKDGELYGMTSAGGLDGSGVIFSLLPDGSNYTLLHNFAIQIDNGADPRGRLISEGNLLYGLTSVGGENLLGAAFSIATDGTGFSLIHSCLIANDEGGMPMGSLISDGSRLYGMNTFGFLGSNYGTIFSLKSDGSDFTLLHSFSGGTGDGEMPYGSLILSESTLYGTTSAGGQTDAGIVFSIGTGGEGYSIIHDFEGAPVDGVQPLGDLTLAGGSLYGMTSAGGLNDRGVIYSLKPDGSDYTIVYNFAGYPSDGGLPYGSLLSKGTTLYGMTSYGGQTDAGTIFSLNRDGLAYTMLYEFTGPNGANPLGSLIADNSTLYGMTMYGNPSGAGVIFSYQLPSPTPSPAPTPEYMVISSGDYNGDGDSDLAVFRPASGLWAVRGLGRIYFGAPDDIPVPGDYNGDGYTDVGIFRPATGLWAIKDVSRVYFGDSGSRPVPGDYDGDGSCDVAVLDKTTGLWSIRNLTSVYFGSTEDLPVPADYTGDGISDIGIFRPASSLWAIRGITRVYFGGSGDTPVPGDYQWYGGSSQWVADIAIFRPATGLWAVRGGDRYYFGSSGDIPLSGNFSGGALETTGIFRRVSGLWAIRGVTRVYFGGSNDIPVTR